MWNWILEGFVFGLLLLSATHIIKSIRAYFTSVAKLKRLNNQVSDINKKRKGNLEWLKSNLKVDEKEVESIINLTLADLLVQLKSNQLTSERVLKVYTWKAIEATEATNCVTDFLYVQALSRARQLDQLSDEEKGPLHGLPFSVKEHFFVKDQEVTVGLYSRLGQKPDKNAALVEALMHLGAVPFCRTNLPQSVSSFDCSNPIYGTTCHPRDPSRTPGGSSGGEAALIAMKGSILGLGSDSGGSIRAPAHNCGIVGLKPTSGRLPLLGQACDGGLEGIPGGAVNSSGFMVRTVEDLYTIHQIVLDHLEAPWDPRFIPIPWKNPIKEEQKLTFGWYDFDGVFEATPGCRRAVQEAVLALQKNGHQVLPFCPPHLPTAMKVNSLYRAGDLGATNKAQLSIGPVSTQSLGLRRLQHRLPATLRTTIATVVKWTCSEIMGEMFSLPTSMTAFEVWQLNIQRLGILEDILEKWQQAGVDVLICPAFGVPAQIIGYPGWLQIASSYTSVYNTLDFPAGSMPITKENEEDQTKLRNSYPENGKRDLIYEWAKQGSTGALGMPLNVQVVGKPWQEETVLAAMSQLQDAIHFVNIKNRNKLKQ